MIKQAWISDINKRRVKQIKQSFYHSLIQQTHDLSISYYDFLLVAKKISFRFQQSSHLMSLKNYFNNNRNSVSIKRLTDMLCISHQSLISKDDKIIIKFNVPEHQFGPIKQANEDQQQYYENESSHSQTRRFQKGSHLMGGDENNQEINEKIMIILSIKIEEMEKKLKVLTDPYYSPNIFTVFNEISAEGIGYEEFRTGILTIITNIKEKIRISEDDIKSLFYLLDDKSRGYIIEDSIERLKNLEEMGQKMKNFYFSRINKDMVKNTLFKLGKVKNSTIQIYQLKNASLLEFEQLEQQIMSQSIKHQTKKKIPHFGPLKTMNKKKQHQTKAYTLSDQKFEAQSYSTSNNNNNNKINYVEKQRQKIERILRLSKEQKKKEKTWETITSRLRSLFIHKVILPREKMLEDEKLKYRKNRYDEYQLTIQPTKEIQ